MMILDYAQRYLDKGWAVLPLWWNENDACACGKNCQQNRAKHPLTPLVPHGLKDATRDKETVTSWFMTFPRANIGIVCDGLVVLDVDPRHGGDDSLFEMEKKNGKLPDTVRVLTGGGGQHVYFVSTDKTLRSCSLAEGLDVRANGSYVVAPPSVHKSGMSYTFEVSSDLDTVLAEIPSWMVKMIKRPISVSTDNTIPTGERNEMLTRIAGSLRGKGLGEDAIHAVLLTENQRCKPPLDESEVRTIARSVARYHPNCDENLTDLGNARRLVHLHGDKIRYAPEWGWLAWTGKQWEVNEGQAMRYAKETVKTIAQETTADAEKLKKWALNSESDGRLKATLSLAQSELGVEVKVNSFDAAPLLLNCDNGVLDLGSMTFLPHDPVRLITKRTGIAYDKDAECSRWLSFLFRVLGSQEMVDFAQRAIGYSLTGSIEEECLFFLYGTGFNGKSTFTDTIEYLFGDYAKKAPSNTLMVKKFDGIPNDIARLHGARLVTVQEVGEGQRLNENVVKDLTGGDTITARFLNKEFFEFKPSFKIWMYGNHKPGVRGTDKAIWRRIHLLPFTVMIPEEERDPSLKGPHGKLCAELPGILSWAVRGYSIWKERGLMVPQAVKKATEFYRQEMDIIAAFLEDCCVLQDKVYCRAGLLYHMYQEWCEKNGESGMSNTTFGRRMVERGLEKAHDRNGWYYIGVGLLHEMELPPDG